MRLAFIEMAGFRGAKGKFRLDLADGYTVICGPNGVGKSTCCDAIEFGLTGTIARLKSGMEGKEKASDYIWWKGDGAAGERFVRLGLADEVGEISILERRPELEPAEADALVGACLYADGFPAEDAAGELARTIILRGEELVETSIGLGESKMGAFMGRVLGTGQTERLAVSTKNLREHSIEVVNRVRRTYDDMVVRRTEALAQFGALTASIPRDEELEAAREALGQLVGLPNGSPDDRLVQLAEPAIKTRRQLGGDLRELESDLGALLASGKGDSGLAPESEAVKAAGQTLEAAVAQAEAEIARVESAVASQPATSERLKLHAQLLASGQVHGREDDHCPLCGSAIGESYFRAHVAAALERIEEENAQLASLMQLKSGWQGELAVRKARLEEARGLGAERDRRAKTRAELEARLRARAEQLEVAGASPTEWLTDVTNMRESAEREVHLFVRAVSTLASHARGAGVAELERRVNELSEAVARAEMELQHVEAAQRAAAGAEESVRRLGVEQAAARFAGLSPLFTELYYRLRPHPEWQGVDYKLRGEVTQLLRIALEGERSPRFMFSSGQRRALALAFMLTAHLACPWSKLDSLVLDDPVQHVDDFRALHLVEVLASIRNGGRQVVCAVEDPELAKLMCRRLGAPAAGHGSLVTLEYSVKLGIRVVGVEEFETWGEDYVLRAI